VERLVSLSVVSSLAVYLRFWITSFDTAIDVEIVRPTLTRTGRCWGACAWLPLLVLVLLGLERVMNSIRNGLGIREDRDREGSKPPMETAFLCDFRPSS
jgi:hypothetical protein